MVCGKRRTIDVSGYVPRVVSDTELEMPTNRVHASRDGGANLHGGVEGTLDGKRYRHALSTRDTSCSASRPRVVRQRSGGDAGFRVGLACWSVGGCPAKKRHIQTTRIIPDLHSKDVETSTSVTIHPPTLHPKKKRRYCVAFIAEARLPKRAQPKAVRPPEFKKIYDKFRRLVFMFRLVAAA